MAAANQGKATAQGDLTVTNKDLAEDEATRATLQQDCMAKANDFEAESKSRAEELAAIAKATEIIKEKAGGAADVAYGLTQASFLQVSRSRLETGADLANFEAVRFVRDLARKQNSPALAQLASRMASAIRYGTESGSDQFGKVKALINDLIARLEKDAQADASHKAFCDKELYETNAKKDEKTAAIEKLTNAIAQAEGRKAKLEGEVSDLGAELANLARTQAEMDGLRQKENARYNQDRSDTLAGIEGVKAALKVLREYYAGDHAHDAADGAAGGIVGLLEVCESDFSRGLAEMDASEQSSASAYDKETKNNAISKAAKEQDVKYKNKEIVGLDKAISEAKTDRDGVNAELDAVNEYLASLKEQCIAKAEPYAERKARREAEIAGLRQALEILDGQSLLQTRSVLRGAHKH